ncbi:MAG: alpha-2-macroglobulin, partial [Chitinophagaceae bacterium]
PATTSGEWKLTGIPFAQGYYEVAITTVDKNGGEIKDVQYIEIYDAKDRQLAIPKYLWAEGAKPIEPGEKATVRLGSSADNLFIVQQVDKNTQADTPASGKQAYSFLKLNNEKRAFDFSAEEKDRGGYGVGWMFIKHNRVYQYDQTITVPWTNKELNITYATYRDKTLPGSEEKWSLKISGYKNEKLAAELLASMYDASLDQYYPHEWGKPYLWPSYYKSRNWNSSSNFVAVESMLAPQTYPEPKYFEKRYDELLSFDNDIVVVGYGMKSKRTMAERSRLEKSEEISMAANTAPTVAQAGMVTDSAASDESKQDGDAGQNSAVNQGEENIAVRKNFNETAFFFPELRTDSTGSIEFTFTIPEALTRWKFQALAHTKEGAIGYSQKEIITQKELMVQPNAPRFLREGDKMDFSAKVVNLSDKELTGQAELQLVDATTNQPVDGWFGNMAPSQFFTVAPGQSEAVLFPITVPFQFNKALVWRVVAKAANFSDGEESAMPVLTNRMLVTETLPLTMKGIGTKNFSFEKLLKSGGSETLQNHSLTVEYTSNPAWYAVQSLPYLMEYPYDCAEQTWNRYYANTLASFIANSSPRIRQVFESWKMMDSAALLSNLQKNEELKSILL